jgi:hypothetical protein
VQARDDAASEHGLPACLITMEFCHFTVRQTGRAIDCFYMTRSGELYQRGRTVWGGGLWNWKEPMRAHPAVTMILDDDDGCCICMDAVKLCCGWLLVRGHILNFKKKKKN